MFCILVIIVPALVGIILYQYIIVDALYILFDIEAPLHNIECKIESTHVL